MFNILKRNTIEVFCYTNNKTVNELFQIKKSNNLYPQWWKSLPKYECPINSQATMKGCPGFLEFYKLSFTMPLWSDMIFYTNNDGDVDVEIASDVHRVTIHRHNQRQHEGFFDTNNFGLIKIEPPWVFSCKENIHFFTCGAFYENFDLHQNIQIVPGVTNYHLNHFTNIFLIIKKFQNEIFVKHSTPFRHFFPLTDKNVVFICDYDQKKYEEFYNKRLKFSFLNTMHQYNKLLKKTGK